MNITGKRALEAKRFLAQNEITSPRWQDIAEDLWRLHGKAELSKGEVAAYMGCDRRSERLEKLLAALPYVGENTGKRWHVNTIAKAYAREFHHD